MKRLIYLCMLAAIAFIACNDEPVFPDPGLDMTKDVRDTVRRDTIDVYHIEMQIKAPNGIREIQVLNGRDYSVEAKPDGYAGKKEAFFSYPIPLPELNRDTTFMYVVKVIDNDLRAYNKGFALCCLQKSTPIIQISGKSQEGQLTVMNKAVDLKLRLETGLYAIKNLKIYGEDKAEALVDSTFHTDDTVMYQSIYKKMILLPQDMQVDEDYTLKIELKDVRDSIGTNEVKVRLIESQRPGKVYMMNYGSYDNAGTLLRELAFHYNQEYPDVLDSITGALLNTSLTTGITTKTPFKYTFKYDENRTHVTEFSQIWDPSSTREGFCYQFEYDDQGRCTHWQDILLGESDSKNQYIIDEWLEDGRIFSFKRDETDYSSLWTWHYEENLSGDKFFAEYNLQKSSQKDKEYCTGVTPWLIPTHLPQLPAFECYNTGFNSDVLELLMYQCGFEAVYGVKNGKNLFTYLYTTDEKGRLKKFRRKSTSNNSGREYVFEYED